MNEKDLQQYLLEHFPKESAACEWKEFKSLRHALVGSAGSDVISYLSAIANMDGGHLVIGVEGNFHLGTTLLFDIGVYLVVLGGILSLILRFYEDL